MDSPLSSGTRLGRYEIRSKIGEGGMGEVYLAQDTRLDRKVALKILPAEVAAHPDRMKRFVQEAKAAAVLNHPHIATIYEIGEADGQHFIAMEYVEGLPLSDRINGSPLDVREIVQLGIQLADALDEAHRKGITHRDIKPLNIMITTRGQAKLLDFGLAKVRRSIDEEGSSDAATQLKTAQGVVIGTVVYMSPEQALGQAVDPRSDIFSLGAVLYEMATGRLPFSGSTTTEIVDQIAHVHPEAVSRFNYNVPAELERIIRKCLEKDKGRRYQSARELLVDLENLKRDSVSVESIPLEKAAPIPDRKRRRTMIAALALLVLALAALGLYLAQRSAQPAETGAIDSIAVLPLVNASNDANMDYLSDGITESLINSLSRMPKLKVMARTTVFSFKNRPLDPIKIGRELGVSAVLTGRVVQRGDALSIQADLVDVASGTQLWGERYDRKLTDILAVQDEIARHISEKLRFKLTGEEQQRLAKRNTENAEAYQLYLLGRFHWSKFTEEEARKSIDYFNQALAKDPNYALAYHGLSDAYQVLGQIGFRPNEVLPKAIVYADKALAVDPTLPEAHLSRGACELWYGWNWTMAEQELKRAMELNPNIPDPHDLYGQFLSGMGRFDEAIAESKRAMELDPLSLIRNSNLGGVYYWARKYDLAIGQSRKVMELDANSSSGPLIIGQAFGQQGKYPEAIAELIKARDLPGGFVPATSELAYLYAVSGQRTEAQKMLQELQDRAKREFVDPYYIAIIQVGLGDAEQTFVWLKKAYEERSYWLLWLRVEPKFDRLRSDPRFAELVRRVGLPQ